MSQGDIEGNTYPEDEPFPMLRLVLPCRNAEQTNAKQPENDCNSDADTQETYFSGAEKEIGDDYADSASYVDEVLHIAEEFPEILDVIDDISKNHKCGNGMNDSITFDENLNEVTEYKNGLPYTRIRVDKFEQGSDRCSYIDEKNLIQVPTDDCNDLVTITQNENECDEKIFTISKGNVQRNEDAILNNTDNEEFMNCGSQCYVDRLLESENSNKNILAENGVDNIKEKYRIEFGLEVSGFQHQFQNESQCCSQSTYIPKLKLKKVSSDSEEWMKEIVLNLNMNDLKIDDEDKLETSFFENPFSQCDMTNINAIHNGSFSESDSLFSNGIVDETWPNVDVESDNKISDTKLSLHFQKPKYKSVGKKLYEDKQEWANHLRQLGKKKRIDRAHEIVSRNLRPLRSQTASKLCCQTPKNPEKKSEENLTPDNRKRKRRENVQTLQYRHSKPHAHVVQKEKKNAYEELRGINTLVREWLHGWSTPKNENAVKKIIRSIKKCGKEVLRCSTKYNLNEHKKMEVKQVTEKLLYQCNTILEYYRTRGTWDFDEIQMWSNPDMSEDTYYNEELSPKKTAKSSFPVMFSPRVLETSEKFECQQLMSDREQYDYSFNYSIVTESSLPDNCAQLTDDSGSPVQLAEQTKSTKERERSKTIEHESIVSVTSTPDGSPLVRSKTKTRTVKTRKYSSVIKSDISKDVSNSSNTSTSFLEFPEHGGHTKLIQDTFKPVPQKESLPQNANPYCNIFGSSISVPSNQQSSSIQFLQQNEDTSSTDRNNLPKQNVDKNLESHESDSTNDNLKVDESHNVSTTQFSPQSKLRPENLNKTDSPVKAVNEDEILLLEQTTKDSTHAIENDEIKTYSTETKNSRKCSEDRKSSKTRVGKSHPQFSQKTAAQTLSQTTNNKQIGTAINRTDLSQSILQEHEQQKLSKQSTLSKAVKESLKNLKNNESQPVSQVSGLVKKRGNIPKLQETREANDVQLKLCLNAVGKSSNHNKQLVLKDKTPLPESKGNISVTHFDSDEKRKSEGAASDKSENTVLKTSQHPIFTMKNVVIHPESDLIPYSDFPKVSSMHSFNFMNNSKINMKIKMMGLFFCIIYKYFLIKNIKNIFKHVISVINYTCKYYCKLFIFL